MSETEAEWIKRCTAKISNAIGGGSELFTRHGEQYRLDIDFVCGRIREMRVRHHEAMHRAIRAERAALKSETRPPDQRQHDLGLKAAIQGFSTATPYSEAYAKEQMSAAIGRYLEAAGLRLVPEAIGLSQEECAALIDQMLKEPGWANHPRSRLALAVAARTIRRGRGLSSMEKWENIKAWAEDRVSLSSEEPAQ